MPCLSLSVSLSEIHGIPRHSLICMVKIGKTDCKSSEKSLRKHAYSNILKILLPKKKEISQIKNSDIVHISALNIDCGYLLEPPRRDGSNEYPQSMLFSLGK